MTRNEALRRMLLSNGRFFAVRFIKRSTGEVRTMTCRLGVHKHLKGGEVSYNAAEHNLLGVFDMVKRAYRSIPLENVLSLKVKGSWLPVE